jgi:hypothetical protein
MSLIIYDINGRKVKNLYSGTVFKGLYEVEWNGENQASGVYIYQLKVGNPSAGSGQSFVETKKMILLR